MTFAGMFATICCVTGVRCIVFSMVVVQSAVVVFRRMQWRFIMCWVCVFVLTLFAVVTIFFWFAVLVMRSCIRIDFLL